MKCGLCREVCPVFLETGHEAMVARGRVQLLKALLENRLDLSDGLRDRIYACLSCNACHVICPCGIEVEELILASREAMVRAGKPLPESQQTLRDRIVGEQNPFGEKRGERAAWLPEKYRKPRPSPVVLHAGCAISYANNRVGRMILQILEMAGADFMMMGDEEECCGDPILRMGDVERAQAQRRRTSDAYRQWGVETIVTPCAGCLKMFKHYYAQPATTQDSGLSTQHSATGLRLQATGDRPQATDDRLEATGDRPQATDYELQAAAQTPRSEASSPKPVACSLKPQASSLQPSFRVLHTLEWFAEMLADGRLKPRQNLAKRIAYLDGCDIGRHSGVFEPPRQVLRAIPGVEIVEFPAHHESSRCCGGPLMAGDPAMAASIASKRVREALDASAEMIAVACPTCFINLKEGANRAGVKIEIQDVTALLHRTLK